MTQDQTGLLKVEGVSLSDVNRDDVRDSGNDKRGVPTGHSPQSCVARSRPNKPPCPV